MHRDIKGIYTLDNNEVKICQNVIRMLCADANIPEVNNRAPVCANIGNHVNRQFRYEDVGDILTPLPQLGFRSKSKSKLN